MAFFRFSRDKRGYENFYLVQPTTNRRGKVRTRVLYWFRSPPDVKVGREPFDEDVRRALEAQNPDVTFDWASILDAPIPSADADKWRERRRVERAAKQGVAASSDVEVADEPAESAEADPEPTVLTAAHTPDPSDAVANVTAPTTPGRVSSDATRKRRRRRRSRRPDEASPPQPRVERDDAPALAPPHEPGDPTGD
jgi:hypothetical protein